MSALPFGSGHLDERSACPLWAIGDIYAWQHPVKACLALPSDPSYSVLWVGLPAMAEERPVRVERRLSAILAADVAGYSRLMHHDEETTHAKLTALLADAVEPSIAEHGGRLVKNTGDGFLADFPSAVQAVRAAVQFLSRNLQLVTRKTDALLCAWASISAT
jgi:class 3 adenylate cyclase